MFQDNKVIKYFLCVFICIIVGMGMSGMTYAINNATTNNTISTRTKKFIQQHNIPGVVLSIKLPNHKIETFVAGVADIAAKKAMKTTMLFPIGSITKSFTSVAILQLVSQDKLTLQTTLSEIANKPSGKLSKLIEMYPKLGRITIQELLNHTSGLPSVLTTKAYEEEFEASPLKHLDSKALISLALKQDMLFSPSSGKFHYSNTDYILVQMAYNTISSNSLSKAIHKLLTKVGVKTCFYPRNEHSPVPSFILDQISQGYMPENPYWPAYLMKVFRRYPKVHIKNGKQSQLAYNVTPIDISQSFIGPAAGGVIMSVPDMVKWYEALFINHTILPSSALKKMLTGFPTHDGYQYGLGITKRFLKKFNVEVYSHTGSSFGFNTNVIYIRGSGIVIAVAINSQKDLLRFDIGLIPDVLKALQAHGYLKV